MALTDFDSQIIHLKLINQSKEWGWGHLFEHLVLQDLGQGSLGIALPGLLSCCNDSKIVYLLVAN